MRIELLEDIEPQKISHGAGLKYVFEHHGYHAQYFTQAAFGRLSEGDECFKHVHNTMIEIFYFISGKGIYEVNREKISIVPGTFLRIDAGEEHSLNSIEETLEFFYIGIPTKNE